MLAIGIWTQMELKSYMELTEMYYDNAAYIMIGVGALILLVALGGFYCTAKDKIALLYMVRTTCVLEQPLTALTESIFVFHGRLVNRLLSISAC